MQYGAIHSLVWNGTEVKTYHSSCSLVQRRGVLSGMKHDGAP